MSHLPENDGGFGNLPLVFPENKGHNYAL